MTPSIPYLREESIYGLLGTWARSLWIHWSRGFEPNLHLIAVWVQEKDVGQARGELALANHLASRAFNLFYDT